MNEIAGNLPRTFISFGPLRKQSKLQETRHTEKSQQLVISSPRAVVETIEIPETDTSPVETMTVLQSAQRGIDIGDNFSLMDVDPVGSVQGSGDSDVNAYCEDRLRSLSESELQILAEVGEELIADFLTGPSSSGGAADVLGFSHGVNSSTPIKRRKLTGQGLLPIEVPPLDP